jgi:hypothetical protein
VDNNPFDDLGKKPETTEHHPRDYLIHQVFKQSAEGAELLRQWKEVLIMTPTVKPSSTQMEVGISEGQKLFIRNILLTINKVENDD